MSEHNDQPVTLEEQEKLAASALRFYWYKMKIGLVFQITGAIYAFILCYPHTLWGLLAAACVVVLPMVFVPIVAIFGLFFSWSIEWSIIFLAFFALMFIWKIRIDKRLNDYKNRPTPEQHLMERLIRAQSDAQEKP